jgi:hypothetical protein
MRSSLEDSRGFVSFRVQNTSPYLLEDISHSGLGHVNVENDSF